MSYLPVVERELRVAARRKSTHYARAAAALLGLVISFFMLVMFSLGTGAGAAGNFVFTVLSWYALLMTLLAGVFLASDSLSEERREGTLGLLFLTDLKGYDVVLGKFMAVSLNAFYGLLAFFPILAICLLPGGVSLWEFWRICVALLNILFFSITAGMLVSSFCRSAVNAMTGSIVLLVLWAFSTSLAGHTVFPLCSTINPLEPFFKASDAEYFRLAREYWTSLAISHVLGWIFLACAAWRLRSFTDKAKTSGVWQRISRSDLFRGTAARRSRLLDINPVLWMLDESRRMRWLSWFLALAAIVVLVLISIKAGPEASFVLGYAMWPFYFLLKIFVAAQACRFFVEARRTGSIELLCCTPLTMRTIIKGQWMLLRSVFLWPLSVLLSAHLLCLCYNALRGHNVAMVGMVGPMYLFMLYREFAPIANNLADFFAIGWFGMWLALGMKRPQMATGATILCVIILPMILVCVPTLIIDAIFIVVCATQLSLDFRLRQAQWVTSKPAPT